MTGQERLRRWRDQEGLTQIDAAMRLGVNPSMWSRWESGAWRPSTRHAASLEQMTGIPVAAWHAEPGPSDEAPPDLPPDTVPMEAS